MIASLRVSVPLLLLPYTFSMQLLRDFHCTESITQNMGIKCGSGTSLTDPEQGGCCATCAAGGAEATVEGCCPNNCRKLSMSTMNGESTCTCTNENDGPCEDTIIATDKLAALSSSQRWTAAHNVARCLHGYPGLTWNTATYNYAKSWADQCTYAHSSQQSPPFPNGGNGENLATQRPAYAFPMEQATYAWYSEVTSADGGRGYKAGTTSGDSIYGASGGPDQVGHYTALIWKNTTQLGCAICPNDANQNQIQVCQYAKMTPNLVNFEPNVAKYYIENVPQSNALVATESSCCAEAYNVAPASDSSASVNSIAVMALLFAVAL